MSDLIEKLSNLRSQFNCFDENERDAYHTLSEAIKVLSEQPEPCEDAVSRKAVEEMLQNGFPTRGMWEIEGDVVKQTVCETLADALMDLGKLPSVTPKRKKGKWNFIGDQMFECSECGTCYTQSQFYQMRVRISDTEFPKFCPNCGSEQDV